MTNASLKHASTIALQTLIVLLGIAVLTFLIWEPTVEGVNASATSFSQIYLDDPFLAYAYASSILFFVGLYQAFKLFGYIGQNQIPSPHALKAVRMIRYCAMTLIALVAAPLAYLIIVRPEDDIAGGVAMGLFAILMCVIVSVAAAMFERRLRNRNGINL